MGRSTIARILKRQGLAPVPARPTSWHTFLRANCGVIAGANFYTTEVWTWRGVPYYSVFVIDLASRRVHVVASTPHPNGLFMRTWAGRLALSSLRAPGPSGLRVDTLRPVETIRVAVAVDVRTRNLPSQWLLNKDYYTLKRDYAFQAAAEYVARAFAGQPSVKTRRPLWLSCFGANRGD